jgi:hypothetical protein
VGSPSAANKGAEFPDCAGRPVLWDLRKIFLDEPDLHLPAALVRFEGLGAASQRNLIEARFRNFQQNSSRASSSTNSISVVRSLE